MSGGGALREDQHLVRERVTTEAAHYREQRQQRLAGGGEAGLELVEQGVDRAAGVGVHREAPSKGGTPRSLRPTLGDRGWTAREPADSPRVAAFHAAEAIRVTGCAAHGRVDCAAGRKPKGEEG